MRICQYMQVNNSQISDFKIVVLFFDERGMVGDGPCFMFEHLLSHTTHSETRNKMK